MPLSVFANLLPHTVRRSWWLVVGALWLTGCAGGRGFTESGKASFYADKFNGRATASGEPYRPGKMTAAHKTLPFGTVVRVTNTETHQSVKVRINDRGPHVKGRIVDLSKKAAHKIGLDDGLAPVKLRVVKPARGK
ncbi:septal ring lytic transglycosylase RlpA family protein [Hymenobacter busanensis]|uniref:Probable endolytic peptidoglycan transglycosylase RlpA n=1 Tax=Hymenobacter busanensis TaxID=2607656 RepID=A0A7L5A3B7_9BACT|nr:septal ring lytic transglycosylase RlpA family protein [Hymenobacter busanensis]KAA9332986.1 septal ring lytic transglycosylase RlpA family protein [Hymenobacter busanensis]QHJ08340.1 septal ring lytic transglycosylase RlpA family protein [Hymenobacter busanensis]